MYASTCVCLYVSDTSLLGRIRKYAKMIELHALHIGKHTGEGRCRLAGESGHYGRTERYARQCYYVIFEITRFYLSKGPIRIPIVNQAARTSRSEGEVHQNAQSLPLRTHTPGHHASNSPEPRQSSRPATSTRNGGPSAEHSAAPA